MARKSKKGTNIYLRKDGRWEGRHPKGKKKGRTAYTYVYGKTYDEAAEKLAKLTKVEVPALPPNSFASIAQEWMKNRIPRLKASTINAYTNVINRYLVPAFVDKEITAIKRCEVTTFVSDLLAQGGVEKKGLAPATVNQMMTVCKKIFHYAAREKELLVADVEGISIKKQEKKEPPTLSKDAQERLVTWLCDHISPCALGILIALLAGLRIGEICALKWKDISKVNQSISVTQTMIRVKCLTTGHTKVVIQSPKSASSRRIVPVNAVLGQLLEACRQDDNAFLLTGDAVRYMEPRTLQRRFKKVLKECGLEDINFHALRHTFATESIERGFDCKTLSDILGYSSVSITLNFYVHPSMEQKQKNMNLLPALPAIRQAAERMALKRKDSPSNYPS